MTPLGPTSGGYLALLCWCLSSQADALKRSIIWLNPENQVSELLDSFRPICTKKALHFKIFVTLMLLVKYTFIRSLCLTFDFLAGRHRWNRSRSPTALKLPEQSQLSVATFIHFNLDVCGVWLCACNSSNNSCLEIFHVVRSLSHH